MGIVLQMEDVWAAKVCPQLIGVWARTIRGNNRIAIEIKIKMKNLNFDLGSIFQPEGVLFLVEI
jgi:hypothetical protein